MGRERQDGVLLKKAFCAVRVTLYANEAAALRNTRVKHAGTEEDERTLDEQH